MKYTIVPAQVTTVEDRVTGNLTLTQLLLLMSPICLCGVVYILFPPNFRFSYPKAYMLALFSPSMWVLALRIKGKLLISWAVIMLHYMLRPKLYIFNKNDQHLRLVFVATKSNANDSLSDVAVAPIQNRRPVIEKEKAILVESLIDDPQNSLTIQFSKEGGFNVALKEIK